MPREGGAGGGRGGDRDAVERRVAASPVMRGVRGGVGAIALAGALYAGSTSVSGAPALGPFLDPAHGVWAAARAAEFPRERSLALEGLGGEVEVRYDDRGVPHIFGASEPDVARALGWVHARDRLFQMEVTQRAVAGTLAELVGARAVELDRTARRQGLAEAADAKWAAVPQDSPTRAVVTAYMEGVNAYVRAMPASELPVEYRLVGRRPRTFEPKDTYYLLARMALTLAWQDEELQRGAIEAVIGEEATAALFPVDAPIQEPIEPVPGRQTPRMAAGRFPAPRVPGPQEVADARAWMSALEAFGGGRTEPGAPAAMVAHAPAPRGDDGMLVARHEGAVGSNNWAVAPERSASGHALLSGDPHLSLSLPSIWYEAHLVVPGELDVYGVTFPLAPIVPIGFNRDVAWTATNTGADVMDFYRETVDDSVAPRRYQVDGAWRDLTVRVEEYRDPSGRVIAVDTLWRTHRGPMLRSRVGFVSMRWTALEPSDEGDAFRRAMRARSAEEWYVAMADYKAPAQNFLVADRAGAIGIRSTGRYPIRPGDGRGDRVFDGSTSASDWTGDWPLARYPQALRPEQGYLASANQQPLDPSVRPGYLGWNWPAPWRALRINEILREERAMTPEKMRLAQTDPRSVLAASLLRALGDAVASARAAGTLEQETSAAWEVLGAWDGRFDVESRGAVLYEAVQSATTAATWDELVPPGDERRVATPNTMMLVRLLDDAESVWWDRRATTEVRETRDAVLLGALRDGWTTARARHGNDPQQWRWGAVRQMHVEHLLRLPGFGRTNLSVQSGPGTLSPSEGGFGASWRFVVELGPELQAWGTYPGGQSGNPASARYDDRLPLWQRGELAALRLPRAPAELGDSLTRAAVRFAPAGGAR